MRRHGASVADRRRSRRRNSARHTAAVTRVDWSADGQLDPLCGSSDGTARLWDANSRDSRAVLAGHTKPVVDAAFSDDGRLVATTSFDQTARVWRVASGEQVAMLTGHVGAVTSALFSADARYVVTTGVDGSVRVCGRGERRPRRVVPRAHARRLPGCSAPTERWLRARARTAPHARSAAGSARRWTISSQPLPKSLNLPRRLSCFARAPRLHQAPARLTHSRGWVGPRPSLITRARACARGSP